MTPEQKAKRAAYQKAWRLRQAPEKQEAIRAQIREWHARHREEQNAKRRVRYYEDSERHNKNCRLRRAEILADPILAAAFKEKLRQAKRRRIRGITQLEWEQILGAFNYRCAYCLTDFSETSLPEPDHMIPVKQGGPRAACNIVPACRACNAKKQSKHILRFIFELWEAASRSNDYTDA